MEWFDPEASAEFFNAIAPNAIGGLIALSGVIGLFLLQQNAQRRQERRQRLDAAAEHLMATLNAARETFTGQQLDHQQMSDMLEHSWRFAWQLERKERPVADWAWAVLFREYDAVAKKGQPARVNASHSAFVQIMEGLHAWHTGEKKVTWFKKERDRIREEKVRARNLSD